MVYVPASDLSRSPSVPPRARVRYIRPREAVERPTQIYRPLSQIHELSTDR
jgi:hypothetical protein